MQFRKPRHEAPNQRRKNSSERSFLQQVNCSRILHHELSSESGPSNLPPHSVSPVASHFPCCLLLGVPLHRCQISESPNTHTPESRPDSSPHCSLCKPGRHSHTPVVNETGTRGAASGVRPGYQGKHQDLWPSNRQA